MKLECLHVDTCLSDYWSGHHLPHVQVPVWHGMSMKEIKQSILNELHHGYVMGSTDEAFLLAADFTLLVDAEKRIHALTKAAYAAVRRMKPAKKGQRRFFTDLEKDVREDDNPVYAFFVFVEV